MKTELQTAWTLRTLLRPGNSTCSPQSAVVFGDRPCHQRRKAAGNLNAVNFQSGTWSEKGQLVNADITFKAADYLPTTDPTLAQYAQCQHVQPGVQMWLMGALGAFFSNTTDYPNLRDVGAIAVATRAHGQTTCPLPVALKPKNTCGGPCPKPTMASRPGSGSR
jgi:hypothetical protein